TISQINVEHGICVANQENYLHHLHTTISTKTNIVSQCCCCNFTVNVVIHEPFIDIQIFDDLQKIRLIPTYSLLARKTNAPPFTNDYIAKFPEEIDMKAMDIRCVSGLNDEILEWAYTKAIEESLEKIPEYLQAIYEVSKERNSKSLRKLILEQTQEGAADGSRITLSKKFNVICSEPLFYISVLLQYYAFALSEYIS
ncbi:17136_t:CDS:2, partial [Gigaspora rosea]